ncbi:DUF2147 domain-containing protein [Pelagibacterium lentulum]|uniref:DUF2147 domain-containing protein n=1 Tax=Pelagibacterium lentulum TaxID=2029865 RepID=A0A916VWB4_9HYPH|nr:DUF2147 domain-containing protein [Pelagibacterium lentulum]GGA46238.1 hypothetical protein GCM10011499_14980 [Pelagibacterium lentulum]
MLQWIKLILVVSLAATPFASVAQDLPSPEGLWEVDSEDSRYEVELCGEDNDHLCGTLVWLGDGADNEDNRPYLNTMIVDHAVPVDENEWEGTLELFGHSANGTIEQIDANTIELVGCTLLIVCRSYRLHRIS